MKYLSVLLLLLSSAAFAQSQHGVQLSWSENDPTFPSITYNVYRQTGTCPTVATFTGFTKITIAPVTPESYFDPVPVALGLTVCYEITAIGNGNESQPSVPVSAVFLPSPFSPTSVTTSVK